MNVDGLDFASGDDTAPLSDESCTASWIAGVLQGGLLPQWIEICRSNASHYDSIEFKGPRPHHQAFPRALSLLLLSWNNLSSYTRMYVCAMDLIVNRMSHGIIITSVLQIYLDHTCNKWCNLIGHI